MEVPMLHSHGHHQPANKQHVCILQVLHTHLDTTRCLQMSNYATWLRNLLFMYAIIQWGKIKHAGIIMSSYGKKPHLELNTHVCLCLSSHLWTPWYLRRGTRWSAAAPSLPVAELQCTSTLPWGWWHKHRLLPTHTHTHIEVEAAL